MRVASYSFLTSILFYPLFSSLRYLLKLLRLLQWAYPPPLIRNQPTQLYLQSRRSHRCFRPIYPFPSPQLRLFPAPKLKRRLSRGQLNCQRATNRGTWTRRKSRSKNRIYRQLRHPLVIDFWILSSFRCVGQESRFRLEMWLLTCLEKFPANKIVSFFPSVFLHFRSCLLSENFLLNLKSLFQLHRRR